MDHVYCTLRDAASVGLRSYRQTRSLEDGGKCSMHASLTEILIDLKIYSCFVMEVDIRSNNNQNDDINISICI